MGLDKKYRPKEFKDFVGNEEVIDSLKSILNRETELPATFLFTGSSGCGKTTLARIVANKLQDGSFYKEYNVSDFRGIDTARELVEDIRIVPTFGAKKRVCILNECHQGTKDFWNCLLEVLEEPPSHAHFILCTTDPQKLLPAVKTRCMEFKLQGLSTRKMLTLLKKVAETEVTDFPDDVLMYISKNCDNSPRKALLLLDKVIDIEGGEPELIAVLESDIFTESETIDLCRSLLTQNWKEVKNILNNLSKEPESVRQAILGYFSNILLNSNEKSKCDYAQYIITLFSDSFYYSGKPLLIATCYEVCKK